MSSEGPDPGHRGQPPPPDARPPSPPPQPQPPPRSSPGPAGAGLGPRVGARLLDVLIVGIPLSIVLALVGLGAGAAMDPGNVGPQWLSSLLYSLLWFGYFVWLESSRGATLGKQLLNIQVLGPQGGPPSTEQAMKRNAWMLLGLIPWIGGLLWFVAVIAIMVTIARGSDMQGFHDVWAKTAVLRT